MNSKPISAKETPKLYLNVQQQLLRVVTGSARNFQSKTNSRPVMADSFTQTYPEDFTAYHTFILKEHQAAREKEYVKLLKEVEENIKGYAGILCRIKSEEILEQLRARKLTNASNGYPDQNQPNFSHNNDLINTNFLNNCISFDSAQHNNSSLNRSISTQFSPPIVSSINSLQHMKSSPAKRVEYKNIDEKTGHNNEEPVQLDGTLDLNSSADSERFEICLDHEESVENAETELSATQSCETPRLSTQLTSNEHKPMIKKRKILAAEYNSHLIVKTYENKESLKTPQQPTNEKQPCSSNSLPQTPIMKNRNSNIGQKTSATPTHKLNGSHILPADEISSNLEDSYISLGPNNTLIPARIYKNMNWTSASLATRNLLIAVFTREVLATHSMTGRPSPAFKGQNKPVKGMLDPIKVADIIFAVARKCNVSEKEVRNTITTKCSDENKIMRQQMNKRKAMREKENLFE